MFTFGDIVSWVKTIFGTQVMIFLQLLGGILGAMLLNVIGVILILPVICAVIWCVFHIMIIFGTIGGWLIDLL